MLARAQDGIVFLIKPEIRNLNAVDEQIDEFECSKIGCPVTTRRALLPELPDAESALASRA